ncbi:MAG: hypothetical protein GJU76_07565 [Gallionella sp.]|jgi:hypothetical protein|nr:hypothetical protein [Gallionella sp.]
MNVVLTVASGEELTALRAQIESLQSLLRDRESEADRKTGQIRELEATLKIETLARERAETKPQDGTFYHPVTPKLLDRNIGAPPLL